MPTYKSPYASAFNTGISRGTSFNTVVASIAKRQGKTPQQVWESLFKADHCYRQKFNGQWIYWPIEHVKTSGTSRKASQLQQWQWFTEWVITNGLATPEKFFKNTGSQQEFMTFARKYFGKQFVWTTTKSKSRKRKSTSSTTRKTTSRHRVIGKSKRRSTTARKRSTSARRRSTTTRAYRRAA